MLREWRSRLEVVDDNLRELDDEPTLRKLEGRPGLARAIDRAEDIRKSIRPWSESKQMEAIEDLLNGPSVVLPGATIPLALRSLAASAQERNKVTPAGLLQAMESAFADARDAVFAVDAAWSRLLPSLVQTGREIDALRARAARLGVARDAQLAELAGTLDGLRRQAERDPLGALKTSMADLQPRLDSVRAELDAFERTRASVPIDLDRARNLLEQVVATNTASREA